MIPSSPASVPPLPRRDRFYVVAALAGISLLAWAYLVAMSARMGGMEMGEMLEMHPWSAIDFALMFLMWAVMMVGMMVPTAIPMTLVYAAVSRKAARQGRPVGSPYAFVGGYIVVWTLFSAIATVAQWALDQAALLSPMMVANSPALGAALLIAAGLYQLTPYKEACLERCRTPAHFIAWYMRPGRAGALRLGVVHGWFCLGCCWVLMGLLFLGGVMNLLWIAAITLFVLAEKVLPFGVAGGRVAGGGMIALGAALLAGWVRF